MAENELESDEETKSSKKIIIIAAVVLMFAGGAAGYYFMSGDKSSEVNSEEAEEVVEEEEEGANTEIYYDLNKPLVVNFPKGSAASLIQVSLSLLVKGNETVEALKKHEPMIRNNLLMIISTKQPENLMKREGKEELRSDMLKEIGKVLEKMTGKNKVINIFFTTFVMQ